MYPVSFPCGLLHIFFNTFIVCSENGLVLVMSQFFLVVQGNLCYNTTLFAGLHRTCSVYMSACVSLHSASTGVRITTENMNDTLIIMPAGYHHNIYITIHLGN